MKANKNSKLFQKASMIRDVILSANDGVITTFAVVAGARGANLSSNAVILLGLANLLADAISMASGNYLGMESENEILQTKNKSLPEVTPIKNALLTFIAFACAGSIPLAPYFFMEDHSKRFGTSLILVSFTLIALGFLRGNFSRKHNITTIIETVLVGGAAAIMAYMIGYWGDMILNSA